MEQAILSWIFFYIVGAVAIAIAAWQTYRLWKYSCVGCNSSGSKNIHFQKLKKNTK